MCEEQVMEGLTRQDLDVLFEAVEKWEQDDASGEIMGIMLEGLLGDRSPEHKAKMELERREREHKRKEARRVRQERGAILRAKIVKMKDAMDAESLVS